MILLADSGSTKTEWALINKGESRKFHSAGMNPYFASDDDIRKILNDVKNWIGEGVVNKVVFYGSGCNSTEKGSEMQRLFKEIFEESDIEVHSDLIGAAVSLFGNKTGIAVILGTGANSGYFDGKEITFKTESLGFVLGDEGSGAYLGKELIRELLYENLSKEIQNDFAAEYKIGKVEILENIYKKPYANRFLAGFTVFLKKHETNPDIKKIISNSFESLVKNHLIKYPQKENCEFGFVGSIAWHFKDELIEVCKKHNLKIQTIIGKPMDNLIKYYSK
jgi:N-acetylglucosamine kinase-like BadF-type ATPase